MNDEWSTPQPLFDLLNEEFHFTVDACALPSNAKLKRFWSPEQDGLKQNWIGERVYFNPPYSRYNQLPWVLKAETTMLFADRFSLAVGLLPADTSTKLFHNHLWNHERVKVRFLKQRIKFVGAPTTPKFGSLLAIFTNT